MRVAEAVKVSAMVGFDGNAGGVVSLKNES